MAYAPPKFNLLCSIWDCKFPAGGAADHTAVPVQKYINFRINLELSPQTFADWWEEWQPPVILRFSRALPMFTGIPASWTTLCFEVPEGSGQYYRTYWREVLHEGFPNEYAIVMVLQCSDTGKAIPPPSPGTGLGVATDVCFVPIPVQVLSDTFDDTPGTLLSAHTMNMGPGWTAFSSGCDYSENADGSSVSVDSTGSGIFASMFSDSGLADGTVTAFWSGSGFGDDTFGVVLRATDDANMYCVYWDQSNSRGVLSKIVSGGESIISTVSIPSTPASTDICKIICTCHGSSLACVFRNNTTSTQWTLSSSDSTYLTQTYFGILSKTDEMESCADFSVFTL